MEKKTLVCATQHIKIFHEQSLKRKKADYGEPCTTCPYRNDCNYDWLSIMDSLFEQSEIKINMAYREQKDKRGSDRTYPD